MKFLKKNIAPKNEKKSHGESLNELQIKAGNAADFSQL